MGKVRHVTEVDVTSGEFKADPFPFLKELRNESPVATQTLSDGTTAWLVSKYEDQKILADESLFTRVGPKDEEQTESSEADSIITRTFDNVFTDLDRPAYTRIRKLMQPAFSPKNVRPLGPMIDHITEELLNTVQVKGEMDIVKDYATPLPLKIVLGQLCGVPEEDSGDFDRWIASILETDSLSAPESTRDHMTEIIHYMNDLVRKKRQNLTDDVLSDLIRAEAEGSKLNQDELVANSIALMLGGYPTTVNLIACAVFELLTHPEQLRKLYQDLSLIPLAVEELLRFTSPVFVGITRYAREDVTIRGVVIPKDAAVFGLIGAANRDEEIFENPDVLDITRKPNPHMGFGWGSRSCMGGSIATLEVQYALRNLLARIPDLTLKNPPSSHRWTTSLNLRGLEELQVTYSKIA